MTFDLGGQGKRLRLYRLPERLTARTLVWQQQIPTIVQSQSAMQLSVCVTLEDGHQAWTDPIDLSETA